MKAMILAAAMLCTTPAAAQTQAPPPTAATASPELRSRIDALPQMLGGKGDYATYFNPAFRAAIPEAQWTALLAQVAASAGKPIGIASVDAVSSHGARVQVRYERGLVSVELAVDPAPPHQVGGLRITGMAATEGSVDAVLSAISALPGTTGVSVARLGEGAPVPLHRTGGDRALAIGSEFKLVILAELVRAVAAGERRWDDLVTLDGAPLPGGGYTQKPRGTRVPLRELAERMIAVSDNSATDILIATLGRDRIEAMLPRVGVADPAGMQPFLTTLEAFKIKTLIAQGKLDWVGAGAAARRRMLAGPVAALPVAAIPATLFAAAPVAVDSVEWFATPDDMVRVMDWLRRNTGSGPAAEARAILAKNPGIGTAATAGWGYVGYKGGSEPGVIAMTYLLRAKKDGAWYAIATAWNDPARPVDEGRFVALVSRLVELSAPS